MTICWLSKLRHKGIRPTKQRLAIAHFLFNGGDRHLNAEDVFEELHMQGSDISLATVYNTLNQFTKAGLLRQITVDSQKSYFDTNISDHHHYYFEDEQKLVDIPSECLVVSNMPNIPEGTEIARVDVVIRLQNKKRPNFLPF